MLKHNTKNTIPNTQHKTQYQQAQYKQTHNTKQTRLNTQSFNTKHKQNNTKQKKQ